MPILLPVVAAAVAAGTMLVLGQRKTDSEARRLNARARADADAVKKAAEREAAAERRVSEAGAREAALATREKVQAEVVKRTEALGRREDALVGKEQAGHGDLTRAEERAAAIAVRERELQSRFDRARSEVVRAEGVSGTLRLELEKVAGESAAALRTQLCDGWLEEARAEAAHSIRVLEQSASDASWSRQAQRTMGIACQRYDHHFLTERLLSNVPVPPELAARLGAPDGALVNSLADALKVKLDLHESGEKVRIDSGDGVAREVARRALAKLGKGTAPPLAESDPHKWVASLRENLDREIVDLGRRAFAELEIPKAHPEIVTLVGRLNYRTSYTQNQWKHALEASFLAGMMAAELGLDVKLCRRATLMHDIGKALTHEIEGSHAVIGADYARRLGEAEIVANAIGAHHADEPPNSVYAYLVAAADAMSGARPGARREQTESHSTKLYDLERIGANFRGVDHAFAVQGGRELRVYVRESEVGDLGAVELSSEIAKRISAEMTFPGQIKVTVIRQLEAVSTAS